MICDRCKHRDGVLGKFEPSGLILSNAGYTKPMYLCLECYYELKAVPVEELK